MGVKKRRSIGNIDNFKINIILIQLSSQTTEWRGSLINKTYLFYNIDTNGF